MKKFIGHFIVFSFAFFALLFLLDRVVTRGLRKSQTSLHYNLNKIYNGEINADIVINGSSKARMQISTRIIDSILNVNSYNLGMRGAEFNPQNFQFKQYLKHNTKPKIVIQVVSFGYLHKYEELISYEKFIPYLNKKEVRELCKQYKGFTFLDYHVPFMKYAGQYDLIINGLLNTIGVDRNKDTSYKGYSSQNKKWDATFEDFKKSNPDGFSVKMDSLYKTEFEKYITNCATKNIKLYLVYPPTYHESKKYMHNRAEIITYYKNMANKYQISFLDYSDNELTLSKDNFYNSQHLNKKGAEIFTEILANNINQINTPQIHE